MFPNFVEVPGEREKTPPRSEKTASSRLKLHVLASGSKGNATLVEDRETGRTLLIDCGICKRDFFNGCKEVGVNPKMIEGILITHEHTDHTKGLGVVMRGLAKEGIRPNLYTGTAIRRESAAIIEIQNDCDIYYIEDGQNISISGMETRAFATSHDSAQSFGFRFACDDDALAYMTDTGIVTPQAYEALRDCRILALESNHDKRMLETGPYPYMLKKRVASDKGHLSNFQAAEALELLLSNKLEQVVAMHISENNNTYRLPQDCFAEVLKRNDHPAQAHVAYQHRVVSV